MVGVTVEGVADVVLDLVLGAVVGVAVEGVADVSLGLVLAYARYRTASLWLPIGLHFGFIFPYQTLQQLTESGTQHSPLSRLLTGSDGRSGLLPFCLLLLSALLVHIFIQVSESKRRSET